MRQMLDVHDSSYCMSEDIIMYKYFMGLNENNKLKEELQRIPIKQIRQLQLL